MTETSPTARAPRKDSAQTKQKLVDAAQALIAQQGVENIKLVDVSRAAGQKNRNAAQYHFGDRDGLIHAVLDTHTTCIARQRKTMLGQLDPHNTTMRELVNVLVYPIVDHVTADPNGLTYLRINRFVFGSSAHIEMGWQRTANMPEVHDLQQRIHALMPPNSAQAMRAKMILVQCMLFNGLANFYDLYPPRQLKGFVETLCRSIEAIYLEQNAT
jgi:AcrR family transcriptional regulator